MKPTRNTATLRVDTSRPEGVPLSKERIAIYNSGLVPIERYERDRSYYRRAGAESLRIDLGWGAEWMPRTVEVVQRDGLGGYTYHFEQTDEIARLLAENGTRPYWSYCYVPAAARDAGQNWMTMADDSVWVDTVREYVRTMSGRGVTIGYHEVYNEPDLRDERTAAPHFYEGDLGDYLELYRSTSRAIRDADPSARIGGPALAVTSRNRHWLEAFLGMVVDEDLPLDFLSVHHYGHFSTDVTLDIVDSVLERFELPFLEVHLNEYNSFTIDYPRGGLQDTHFLASAFAADLPRLLSRRSLTRTHWAQFQDSGHGNFSGMIDIDGRPKPIWYVYEFYQSMPNRQVSVEVDGPEGLGGIAGADDDRLGVLVWNRSTQTLTVEVTLDRTVRDARVTVLDDGGSTIHRLTDTRTVTVTLERGALALLGEGPSGDPARRSWRATLRRPGSGEDGWVDVDERTGAIDVSVGAEPGSTTVVLEQEQGTATPSGWTLIRHAPGQAVAGGSITLQVETSAGTERHVLHGDGTRAPSPPPRLERARAADTARYTFDLIQLPPSTRITIQPEYRDDLLR